MASQDQRARRYQIRLDMIGIRRGDKLKLIDRKSETCIVIDPRDPEARVVHRGEVKSLSAACNDAYGVEYNDPASAWSYNGETLITIREHFEAYHRGYTNP